MFKYRSLHGGNNGLVGSGIHFRSSQIKSKSLKNEFENRTVRGTEFKLVRCCELKACNTFLFYLRYEQNEGSV